MTVNWDEPKYDGGSSITGYIIEKKETTSKRWTRVTRDPIRALPLGNNWDVTGLLAGAMYQFRIIAINAAGPGLPSQPSDPVLCRDPLCKRETLRCVHYVTEQQLEDACSLFVKNHLHVQTVVWWLKTDLIHCEQAKTIYCPHY